MAAKGDLPGDIYDVLVEHPDGLTVHEIAYKLEVPVYRVRKAMRSLRLILGENDTLWVVARRQGAREPWVYQLVGGGALVDSDRDIEWTANRVGDATSRIHTIRVGMATCLRDLDHRTSLGRKAVTIERQLRHLEEDLEAIDLKDRD